MNRKSRSKSRPITQTRETKLTFTSTKINDVASFHWLYFITIFQHGNNFFDFFFPQPNNEQPQKAKATSS
jgi:hypothetical protein